MHQVDFKGKRALIRVDFNVPQDDNGLVTDDTRIRAALSTIKMVLDSGGAVILMSHLGRPNGKVDAKYSLAPIAEALQRLLPHNEVLFALDSVGHDAKSKSAVLAPGQVLLLENLRFYEEEEAGNEAFAKELASLGDVYINDAFGTAHRPHASTSLIASQKKGNSYFGLLMNDEISNIDKVLGEVQRPFTAIIGGSKVSDKVGIIENLLPKVDHLIIGGAMAYTFIRAKGGQTGKSKVEEDKIELANYIIKQAHDLNTKIHLPSDSTVADQFSNDATTRIEKSKSISENGMGLDIGPDAIADFIDVINVSQTILWNGPMGVFEMDKFENGTKSIAHAVAQATQDRGAFTLIGGGDSVAAINKYNLADKVSYISTGGGAMLEYLEGKSLPGIEAIRG